MERDLRAQRRASKAGKGVQGLPVQRVLKSPSIETPTPSDYHTALEEQVLDQNSESDSEDIILARPRSDKDGSDSNSAIIILARLRSPKDDSESDSEDIILPARRGVPKDDSESDNETIILARPRSRKEIAKDVQKDDTKPEPSPASHTQVLPLPTKVKGPLEGRIVGGSQNVQMIARIPFEYKVDYLSLGNHKQDGSIRGAHTRSHWDHLLADILDEHYPDTTQINVSFEGDACGSTWSVERSDVRAVLRLLAQVADRCEFAFRVGDPGNVAAQRGLYDAKIGQLVQALERMVGERTTVRIAEEYQMHPSHIVASRGHH